MQLAGLSSGDYLEHNVNFAAGKGIGIGPGAPTYYLRAAANGVGFEISGALNSGPLVVGGKLSSPMTAATAVADNGTIALPTTGINKAVSSATAVTGVILAAGTVPGQMIYLMNVNATNSITFDATPATSNVALASAVIVAGTGRFFSWNPTAGLWYPNTV